MAIHMPVHMSLSMSVHLSAHVCTHFYTHAHVRVYMNVYTHVCTHVCTQCFTHAHMDGYMQIYSKHRPSRGTDLHPGQCRHAAHKKVGQEGARAEEARRLRVAPPPPPPPSSPPPGSSNCAVSPINVFSAIRLEGFQVRMRLQASSDASHVDIHMRLLVSVHMPARDASTWPMLHRLVHTLHRVPLATNLLTLEFLLYLHCPASPSDPEAPAGAWRN